VKRQFQSCVGGFFIVGILCSASTASNPEQYRPLHCHFHFGWTISDERFRISKALKEAGMFVLTFSRWQSTGHSLLLLSISSLLRVQTTVRPCYTVILVYRLSGCLVFIAYCDLQHALSVKYDHVTRNWRRLVQNITGKPKHWGKVVIIDESLGVSQLWGTHARCVIRYKLIIDILHWLPIRVDSYLWSGSANLVLHQPWPKRSLSARGSRSLRSSKRGFW